MSNEKSLAVCIPVAPTDNDHPGGAKNLQHTLASVVTAAQYALYDTAATSLLEEPWDIQITACVDGIPSDGMANILDGAKIPWTFVERIMNPNAPAKNAARNMAVSMSTANYVMCLDQDLMMARNTIMHICRGIELVPEDRHMFSIWFTMDRALKRHSNATLASELVKISRPWRTRDHFNQHRGKALVHIDDFSKREGQPIMHRLLFHRLGGFDPRYIGWGGNKVDLTQRCRTLRIPQYVIGTALLFHQPHGKTSQNNRNQSAGNDLYQRLNKSRVRKPVPPEWKMRTRIVKALDR